MSIITRASSEVAAKEFVAVWRTVRELWLYQVFKTRRAPEFATREGWKLFVSGTLSSSKIKPEERLAICVKFSKYLGLDHVLFLDRKRYSELDEAPGPISVKITADMVRETVSELADLNFFFDMFEVEHELGRGEPGEICRRMELVMRGGRLTRPVPIRRSTLCERGVWLMSVYEFIKGWPGSSRQDLYARIQRPIRDHLLVRSLETTVADLYCYNVTHTLRRRPVLPRY